MLATASLVALGTALTVWLTSGLGASGDLAGWLSLGSGLVCLSLIWAGVIIHQLNLLLIGPRCEPTWAERTLQKALQYKRLLATGATASLAAAIALLALGFSPLSGASTRVPLSMLLVGLIAGGAATLLAGVIVRVIWAVGRKQEALTEDQLGGDRALAVTGHRPQAEVAKPVQRAVAGAIPVAGPRR
jgi:hypothetical protein